MHSPSDMIKAALYYLQKLNYSVIPVSKDKKPLVPWEKYQKERATPKEVLEWYLKYPDANLGIVTGSISGIFVVDVDDASVSLSDYIPDDLQRPIASTPRGGNHQYFKFTGDIRNATGIIPKVDIRGEGGYVVAPPSTNGNGKGWKWASGLKVTDVVPPDPPAKLIGLLKNQHFGGFGMNLALNKDYIIKNKSINKDPIIKAEVNTKEPLQLLPRLQLLQGQRDDAIFHFINLARKGGATLQECRFLAEILAGACVPPFPLKDAMDKVESVFKRSARTEKTVMEDLRQWILSQDGNFNVTDCYTSNKCNNDRDKTAVRMALGRLLKEENPIVRKYGKKRGEYEPILPEDEVVMDITSQDVEPVPLKLPLGIHKYAKILPKNIVIIAGEVNAGKTAFMLNTALLNMDHLETVYFSSEMGEEELKLRLKKFDFTLEVWEKVKFIERSVDFSHRIRPNGLNIIDFLEVHEEFYKVGGLIREIYDRLDKGIAIIALQKNKGREEGLGGERSKEKARLYLAMEPGKIKIVKAKNWTDNTSNPNGMEIPFKLVKGCNFILQ